MAKKIDQSTIKDEAIRLVRTEKTDWEEATAFITEKVAFQMRNLIRVLRKNYWGVFDDEYDPVTGKKKIWIPLTESTVEAVVKNIDLDTKDINFRAKTPKGYSSAQIARLAVRDHLNRIYFGEKLDQFERQLAIDGTAVWKTYEGKDKKGKKTLKIRNVDLLNFYIDPTAESIQETGSVIERAVIDLRELKSYDGWMDVDRVEGRTDINKNDGDRHFNGVNSSGEVEYVEIYERWGLMPKWIITGKEGDNELVEGVIVVSNVDHDPVVHKIELNKREVRPYEEAWFTRVPGRWYGRGIAEKVMMLQLYLNTIINVRKSRAEVSQLGLFKIKKGSGITPQMLSRLGTNGAISVSSMDDIEQMVMQEASQSSYQDESVVQNWTQRVTSAFEVVTGESLPASTPATNAVLQDRNAKSAFTLVKEGLGMFLQRWMDRHALPVIASLIKEKDIVRLSDEENLADILERVVVFEAEKKINEMLEKGVFLDPAQVAQAMDDAVEKLKRSGGLFIKVVEKILTDQVDTQVYVTNEELDTAVIVQNLQNALQAVPEQKDGILAQMFDLMGLPPLKKQPQALPQVEPTQGQPQAPQNIQQITQNANVPQLNA